MIKANVNKWNSSVQIIGVLEQISAEMLILIKSVHDSIAEEDIESAELFLENIRESLKDDGLMNMSGERG